MPISPDSIAWFPTTAWSAVESAKDRDSPGYLVAMNRCIAAYWKPVFYFVRTKGNSHHEAEDLTQEFFLELLKRDWLRLADRCRGRFRTFLLKILVRFLADRKPGRAAKQKVFDQRLVSISTLVGEQERLFQPSYEDKPEHVFMKQWAKAEIEELERLLSL